MKTLNIIIVVFCALGLISCISKPDPIQKEDVEGTIVKIINGNTVELNTGTQIHLEGVDPDNTFTKQYMENHYIGREVYVNIGTEDHPSIESYDEDFDAFVIISENNECINRTLLSLRHDAYYADNIGDQDTLEAYRKISSGGKRGEKLNDTQLAGKMKAASLLVYTQNSNGDGGLGTAFLINKQGLALTNWHVLDDAIDAVVYLSDSEGNILKSRKYGIQRIVQYSSEYDYAIFYVDFDEDTRRNITSLPLSRLSIAAGDEVAAVGNPAPGLEILPMRFASGKISSYNESDRKGGQIGIDVAITKGFSGGPLCNYYGEVVGINKSGYLGSSANLNFAVDIKKVREWLDEEGFVYEGK